MPLMENKDKTITENNDDEISLIDLFAVLIRYRKLICIGTAAVTLLAVVMLFGLPFVQKNADSHKLNMRYTVSIIPIDRNVSIFFPQDVVQLAVYNLNRPQFLAEEHKLFPVFDKGTHKLTDYQYNSFIMRLQNKNITITVSPLKNLIEIYVVIPQENKELCNQLIKDMVLKTEKQLKEYLIPEIEKAKQSNLEALKKIETTINNNTDLSTIQRMQELDTKIEQFLVSFTSFIYLMPIPFIVLEPLGRLKTLAIVFFAALLIFIFIAFILNAIKNIKADSEASSKIADAWNSGKLSKK